jgi:hypothetical protein
MQTKHNIMQEIIATNNQNTEIYNTNNQPSNPKQKKKIKLSMQTSIA